MVAKIGSPVRITVILAATAAVAACQTPAPPPPPPPPPPPQAAQERIPYRPLPPGGASYVMDIPRAGPDGVRQTVNSGVSEDELIWHFRSAWNVAALNCSRADHQNVVDAYSAYIKDHSRALRRVNARIEQDYRKQAGSRRVATKAREQHMTSVYNFFALPPARQGFCQAALDISNRALSGQVGDPIAFAKDNFPLLVGPFETFFREYEQYELASRDWDAKWGAQYGQSQPGWVATQAHYRRTGTRPSNLNPAQTLAGSRAAPTGAVVDPETGATIPVVPGNEGGVSVPVVEPIPNDSGDAGR